MSKHSIYVHSSEILSGCFSNTLPEKILLVPIDFAKSKHVARLCLANGTYLHKQALTIFNDTRGVDYLHGKIERGSRQHKIDKVNIILGGEEAPSYAANFIEHLKTWLFSKICGCGAV